MRWANKKTKISSEPNINSIFITKIPKNKIERYRFYNDNKKYFNDKISDFTYCNIQNHECTLKINDLAILKDWNLCRKLYSSESDALNASIGLTDRINNLWNKYDTANRKSSE